MDNIQQPSKDIHKEKEELHTSGVKLIGENTKSTKFNRFSRDQWNKIEKKEENPALLAVYDTMNKLGNDNEVLEIHNILYTCGDDVYNSIRPQLLKLNLVDSSIQYKVSLQTKKINYNKKTTNKKNDMIINNIIKKFTKSLNNTLLTFSYTKLNCTYGFSAKYAEIRLITFLYAIKYFMDKKDPILASSYELIIGIEKTLKNISTMKGLSQNLIIDLQKKHNYFKNYCNFNYGTMFDKFPRLCVMTVFDTVFPAASIKPYHSQQVLMDYIKEYNAGLYFYKAMIGTGKTTFIIALASYVQKLRMQQKGKNSKLNTQLIFTCSIEPVRHQVARMSYNQEIPFAIAVIDNEGILKVINNYSCKEDTRIIIIADPDATIELLNKSQDYILFVDEPTVGADQANHPITKAIAKIIALCPPVTILSSATLPEPSEINEIVDYYKTKHNNGKVESICSKEALIGCEIINFDGSTIAPHNNCKSVKELSLIVNNLKTKPFIDRLYTAPVVYRLRQKMLENGVTNVINLEEYFKNVDTLTQTSIQKAGIELLESLTNSNSDSLVEKICIPLGKIEIDELDTGKDNEKEQEQEQELNGFQWEDTPKEEKKPIPLIFDENKIFTEQSHRYLGGCLVTVKDPIHFAYEKSKKLLENCESYNRIISKYNSVLDRFNQSLSKLENIKNDDERSKKEQDMSNEHSPEIDFPSHLRINTLPHLMKYVHPDIINKIDKKMLQYNFNLENIPKDLAVPDWIMLLLFSGVGIYSPLSKELDDNYTQLILNLVADGKLAFLISDDNISYGANYPFSHVYIEEELAKEHSIGTIFQLLGRAGRVGQSWVAYGHVGNYISNRIMNYIKGGESLGISTEATNLLKEFSDVLIELKTQVINKPDISKKINTFNENIVRLSDVKPIPKGKKDLRKDGEGDTKMNSVNTINKDLDSWESLIDTNFISSSPPKKIIQISPIKENSSIGRSDQNNWRDRTVQQENGNQSQSQSQLKNNYPEKKNNNSWTTIERRNKKNF